MHVYIISHVAALEQAKINYNLKFNNTVSIPTLEYPVLLIWDDDDRHVDVNIESGPAPAKIINAKVAATLIANLTPATVNSMIDQSTQAKIRTVFSVPNKVHLPHVIVPPISQTQNVIAQSETGISLHMSISGSHTVGEKIIVGNEVFTIIAIVEPEKIEGILEVSTDPAKIVDEQNIAELADDDHVLDTERAV